MKNGALRTENGLAKFEPGHGMSRAQLTGQLGQVVGGCPGHRVEEDAEAGRQCWDELLRPGHIPPGD